VGLEWDASKARENVRKHDGVRFEESRAVFEDPDAITITDDESDPFEERFVSMGVGLWDACWWLSMPTAVKIFALFPHGWPYRTNVRSTREGCHEGLLRFQQR
jgi:hypothetical protein